MKRWELILRMMRGTLTLFVLMYMWIACCLYLLYNVSKASANACFYSGLGIAIITLIESKFWKRKLQNRRNVK